MDPRRVPATELDHAAKIRSVEIAWQVQPGTPTFRTDQGRDPAGGHARPGGRRRSRQQLPAVRAMRALGEFNVHRWAGRMLVDAARLRDKEQLLGRLGHAEEHQ
jgi:hypothetical protein